MSIPTNWRALCAENVSKKARAYLAQPEQEGPTDEELNDICIEHGFVFDDNHGEGLEILSNIVEYVLARWGRPRSDIR